RCRRRDLARDGSGSDERARDAAAAIPRASWRCGDRPAESRRAEAVAACRVPGERRGCIDQQRGSGRNAEARPGRHSGAQGEPRRDKTRAREGFRAEPVQGFTASNAADSDLAQARADRPAAARESATSEGVDRRRMVNRTSRLRVAKSENGPWRTCLARPLLVKQTSASNSGKSAFDPKPTFSGTAVLVVSRSL